MIACPGREGLPQGGLGQVLEAQNPHVILGADEPGHAEQVISVTATAWPTHHNDPKGVARLTDRILC